MDMISLIHSETRCVVTITSDDPLAFPPFVESVVTNGVKWHDLYFAGELDGNTLSDAGCESFGIPVYERYSEIFAHITLVDPMLNLYAVRRSHGYEVVGYATLDDSYCITNWWHAMPEDLMPEDMTAWGPGAAGPDDDL